MASGPHRCFGSSDFIDVFTVDQNGDPWISSAFSLSVLRNGSWEDVSAPGGSRLYGGLDNSVWIAYSDSLFQRVDSAWNFRSTVPIQNSRLRISSSEDLWAFSWGTAAHYYEGDWTVYSVADGLLGADVQSVHTDADGVLWFATDEGVSRYDGHSWISFR